MMPCSACVAAVRLGEALAHDARATDERARIAALPPEPDSSIIPVALTSQRLLSGYCLVTYLEVRAKHADGCPNHKAADYPPPRSKP